MNEYSRNRHYCVRIVLKMAQFLLNYVPWEFRNHLFF